jgi:hypothetical protein
MTKVLISGGLGNQLFQFASGLYVADRSSLELEFASRDLRRNNTGTPEILDFSLPDFVHWNYDKRTKLIREKYRNLLLRISSENSQTLKLLLRLVVVCFNFPFGLGKRRYFINNGVGFDSNILKLSQNIFLVGYFQNHCIPSNSRVLNRLRELAPTHTSDSLDRLILEALSVRPLIVHVRLTDYRKESGIGLLPASYYNASLKCAFADREFSEIWLFSDEPLEAISFIPKEFRHLVKQNLDLDLSSAQTLHLMRYGAGYVIANSTFSWWGAFLRFDEHAPVYAPTPWFLQGKSPKNISPPEWISVNADLVPPAE